MALACILGGPESLPAQPADAPGRLGHGWSPPPPGPPACGGRPFPAAPTPLCSAPPRLTSCRDKLHPGLQSQGEQPTWARQREPSQVQVKALAVSRPSVGICCPLLDRSSTTPTLAAQGNGSC